MAAARGADDTIKFSRNLGIAVEDLQELEFAAGRSGASIGAVRGLLEKAAQFGLMGAAGIEQLADSFKGLDAQTALLRGKAFGFSEEEIRLLRQGGDGIRALRAEARKLGFVITTEQSEKAEKFVDSIFDVKRAVVGLARQAAINALPAIQELTDGFVEWFLQNRALISGGLTQFIEGVTIGVRNFVTVMAQIIEKVKEFLHPLDDWIARLDKLEIISGVVTGGLTIMAGMLGIVGAKFLAMAALIGFATLAIEDLIVFFQGGDSVIGLFFDKFEKEFPGLFALFGMLISWVKDKIPAAFRVFGAVVKPIITAIKLVIDGLIAALKLLDLGLQAVGIGVSAEDKVSKLEAKKQGLLDFREKAQAAGKMNARQEKVIANSIKALNLKIQKIKQNPEFQRQLSNVSGGAAGQAGRLPPVTATIPPDITARAGSTINRGDTTIIVNGAGDPGGVANQVISRAGLQVDQQAGSPGINAQVAQ